MIYVLFMCCKFVLCVYLREILTFFFARFRFSGMRISFVVLLYLYGNVVVVFWNMLSMVNVRIGDKLILFNGGMIFLNKFKYGS